MADVGILHAVLACGPADPHLTTYLVTRVVVNSAKSSSCPDASEPTEVVHRGDVGQSVDGRRFRGLSHRGSRFERFRGSVSAGHASTVSPRRGTALGKRLLDDVAFRKEVVRFLTPYVHRRAAEEDAA